MQSLPNFLCWIPWNSWSSQGAKKSERPITCFPVLESEGYSESFAKVTSMLAGQTFHIKSLRPLRLGASSQHSTSPTKVRGIIVDDILRRLVAPYDADCGAALFQYTLSTKAGCECVAHVLQSLTDLSPEVTVTSMDGVGA